MNTADVLERRAERGRPRGASQVWAAAHRAAAPPAAVSAHGSPLWFRVALALWLVGLMAAASVAARSGGGDTTVISPAQEAADEVDGVLSLPAPILVEGGTLRQGRTGVMRPSDPDYDGGDVIDSVLGPRLREETAGPSEPSEISVVFARPSAPYEGPILGVDQSANGGFRVWGVNADPDEITALAQDLQLTGEISAGDTGLIEVARFDNAVDINDGWHRRTWQFDFRLNDNLGLTVQAESGGSDDEANAWLWLVRLVDRGSADVTIQPVDVLGHQGYVIRSAGRTDTIKSDGDVVWAADGFAYRMTASSYGDNVVSGRDPVLDISRLKIVDRAEWLEALEQSASPTPWEQGATILALATMAGLVLSTAYFLVKRTYRSAALTVVTVVMSWAVVGSGLLLVPRVLALVGLALAWWLHARSVANRAAPEPRTGPSA